MNAEEVVRNIMRAMYRRTGEEETPSQRILREALALNGGLDAQVRSAIHAMSGRRAANARPIR